MNNSEPLYATMVIKDGETFEAGVYEELEAAENHAQGYNELFESQCIRSRYNHAWVEEL